MSKFNKVVKELLDSDFEAWKFKKHFSGSKREDHYKYGNDNNQEVIKGDIPQWALDALADHKPGDTVGKRRRYT